MSRRYSNVFFYESLAELYFLLRSFSIKLPLKFKLLKSCCFLLTMIPIEDCAGEKNNARGLPESIISHHLHKHYSFEYLI